jgi:hypothetical protein
MWLSADPAMGEYIPQAPINDEAKQHNKELPEVGGVFNYVNLHAYHYAGNNPVKLKDPDGRDFYNFTNDDITVFDENTKAIVVRPGEMYEGAIDGAMLKDETIIKVTYSAGPIVNLAVVTEDGEDKAYVMGPIYMNDIGDIYKTFEGKGKLLSGVYLPEIAAKLSEFDSWRNAKEGDRSRVREMTIVDYYNISKQPRRELDVRTPHQKPQRNQAGESRQREPRASMFLPGNEIN